MHMSLITTDGERFKQIAYGLSESQDRETFPVRCELLERLFAEKWRRERGVISKCATSAALRHTAAMLHSRSRHSAAGGTRISPAVLQIRVSNGRDADSPETPSFSFFQLQRRSYFARPQPGLWAPSNWLRMVPARNLDHIDDMA